MQWSDHGHSWRFGRRFDALPDRYGANMASKLSQAARAIGFSFEGPDVDDQGEAALIFRREADDWYVAIDVMPDRECIEILMQIDADNPLQRTLH